MLIVYLVPMVKTMRGEINMLLLGMIVIIISLLYIAERTPESENLQREKLKLDKQLYLNLRSNRF
jgi:hypothetical protein